MLRWGMEKNIIYTQHPWFVNTSQCSISNMVLQNSVEKINKGKQHFGMVSEKLNR